jgi:transitional endoplasmic reticulum ATPase
MLKNSFPAFMHPVRSTRRRSLKIHQFDAYQRLAAIYLLRLVLGLQKSLKRVPLLIVLKDEVSIFTGLDEYLMEEDEDELDQDNIANKIPINKASKTRLLKCVRRRLDDLLAEGIDAKLPLFENIKLIGQALKLNNAEQEILILRLLMPLIEPFRDTVTHLCLDCTLQSTVDYLHVMTTRSASEIHKAMQPTSPLLQMGWFKIQPGLVDLEDKLVLADGLLEIFLREHASADELFANFYQPASLTKLGLADYSHLQNDLEVLIPYLKTTFHERQVGVNILIYGPPGVGKTELAKLLAQTLETPLYEVLCADQEGNALRGNARFTACNVSQKLLSKSRKPSLLLFDEAEDVFPSRHSFFFDEDEDDGQANNHGDKAWINKQLETNPVPVIWISNHVATMDKAYLRRFSYSVEINKMPASIRRRIVNKYSKGLKVSAQWRDKLVNLDQLTPAQIEKATRIARNTQKHAPGQTEQIAERVLKASMRLLKQKHSLQPQAAWTQYDRTFTNTDLDLDALIAGLKRNPRGNFCFYGAPGTGKTALARYIADITGLPLHIKRASDLLDKYLGESEKNIALMFAEAEKQGGILLLDEADSLLADRNHAQRQWEITQVNEMLTQMETFSGIFICTTNLMDKLDAASLRRFDFKVKFDYLSPDQRWALFQQEYQRLGGNLPSNPENLAILKQQVQRLTKLTPGDFAVVSRQVAVLGAIQQPEKMIQVLEQECKAKGETFAQIGFVPK